MDYLDLEAYSNYCHYLNARGGQAKEEFDKLDFFTQCMIAARWSRNLEYVLDRQIAQASRELYGDNG